MEKTFTFVVDFRGGTYCSQVHATNIESSLEAWLSKVREERSEIKYLGEKTLEEMTYLIKDEDHQPVQLTGLKNTWYTILGTKHGSFSINIIQTDLS